MQRSKPQLARNADLDKCSMPLKSFLCENINQIKFLQRIKLDKIDPLHVLLPLVPLEADLVK